MISVVMPAYNSSRFIREAIVSVLSQTDPDFELIVIDDGSTDDTLNIACSFAKRDSRVRVIEAEHGGISKALNLGIQNAKYDWIAIMHADDVALPHRLEKQVNATRSNPAVVVWGAYAYHINSKGKILSVSRTGPTTEEEFYKLRNSGQSVLVIHPTSFLKKEIALKVGGYDSRFDCCEDLEFFDRMAAFGPILALPEPLLLYRIHSASIAMEKFFQQKLFTRYVKARHCMRLLGNQELSLEDFSEEYNIQSGARRLRRLMDDCSKFYYRKAGLFFCEKKYIKAGLYLLVSTSLNPFYVLPRLWRQKLSFQARQLLRESKKAGDRYE